MRRPSSFPRRVLATRPRPARPLVPWCLVVAAAALLAACGERQRTDAGLDIDLGVPDVPPADTARPDAADDAAPRPDARGDVVTDIHRDAPSDGPLFSDAGCGARYARHDEIPGAHVGTDASIAWNSNPPSSGDHFDEWARWGVHRARIPRGYWVHNLEHGGVVVLYRCGADCAAVRDQLEAFVRGLEPEAMCVGEGVGRRILLTEDPEIPTPVAAASWGYTYHANCVDTPSLAAFVRGRTGFAPEAVCANGTYPP